MTEIEKWNAQPYVQRIRQKMEKYKPLFADMTPEGGIDYSGIVVKSAPDYFCSWNGFYSPLDKSLEISPQAMKRYPDITILHEMIHLHENLLDAAGRAAAQRKLRKDLAGKIPNLDTIMRERDALMQVVSPLYDYGTRLAHDNLFFLKSLDLDLHFPKKYQLGRIGGYNFDLVIKLLQAMIDSGTLADQKAHGYIAFERGQK